MCSSAKFHRINMKSASQLVIIPLSKYIIDANQDKVFKLIDADFYIIILIRGGLFCVSKEPREFAAATREWEN